jgi:enamine deaminase RidA (YjgF/YER057c/UK114 family)
MSPQPTVTLDLERLTDGERVELERMGLMSGDGAILTRPDPLCHTSRPPMAREATSVPDVLNEAYDYSKPSSFARALSFDIADATVLLISGTASVDEAGRTLYTGDFRAQCWRTYRNITAILEANDMSWHDIVRTTCYLRDIERDYAAFNEVRTSFFAWQQLDPLPASTGIQARLCREDLLIEIEAIAVAKFGASR